MPVADNRCAVGVMLSGGEASDAVHGRLLLDTLGRIQGPDRDTPLYLLMDRAYKDWNTRYLAFEWGYSPVVPPKKNRQTEGLMNPWEYDTERYKQRNAVERIFICCFGFLRSRSMVRGLVFLRLAATRSDMT
jgi:hypothetical protein